MRKRKTVITQKIAQKFSMEPVGKKIVICSRCQVNEMEIAADAIGGICWKCLVSSTPPEKIQSQANQVSSGRPRGWKWMAEFVDRDGNVFHRGVEQPELKGKLPPTEIIKKSTYERIKEKEKKEMKKLQRAAEKYKRKKREEKLNGKSKTITDVMAGGKKKAKTKKI